MDGDKRKVLLCSCEDTMPLDTDAADKACGAGGLTTARHLCRSQIDLFRKAVAAGGAVTVGCTQEAPLFEEVAGDIGSGARLAFANVREQAGWSDEAGRAGPKMAALLAAAAEPLPPAPFVTLKSDGVALIYGRDETAIEIAGLLADKLDITVVLSKPGDVVPPRVSEFPVYRGTIRMAKGHLGAFQLTIDDFAEASPSSRAKLDFGPGRNGALSKCDLVIDLSGGTPLFPAAGLRDGYVRADPGDPAAVARAALKAGDLVGTFDKPRYVAFHEHLCAHSRSKIVGCTRCLDLCPTGAISPAGNHVAIDPAICAGCGQCAAACPTGAAAYALPPADAVMRRIRTLLRTYRAAGGDNAVVLVHDGEHGEPTIDALARHGAGLPANVLPLRLNEVTQLGLESVAATFAFGAAGLRVLARAKPKHDMLGLYRTLDTANVVLDGLGFGAARCQTVETDDPDALGAALRAIPPGTAAKAPASFTVQGDKRSAMKLALRELHAAAPAPVDMVALPAGAAFGRVDVRVDGCTLCLACVSACPTGALSDNPEKPQLKFQEDLCVQCGLCQATCPEKVIRLEPRLNFLAATEKPVVIKEEEPFCCVECGKPFATRASIERIRQKLEGRHWMFSGDNSDRVRVLMMCEDCRVGSMMQSGLDPYAGRERAPPKTTEDYLRERAEREGGGTA